MDLIEKAAAKLGKSGKSSLVEKAARQLTDDVCGDDARMRAGGISDPAAPREGPANGPAAQAAQDDVAENTCAKRSATSRRTAIDLGRMQSAGIVAHHEGDTRIAEEFRRIKRPVLLKAFSQGPDRVENGNLVMVTSARAGEGKTFTALNLAMSISTERDLTVLLIDADVSHPSIPKTLGIESGPGLVDLLQRGDLDVADILIRTDRDNLSVITAGSPHPHSAELLASDRMARLIREIGKRYSDRIIVFDTPPVLASSEAAVISMHAGQTVFVVEAGKTSESDVAAALNIIGGGKNVGFVLNKSFGRNGSAGSRYYKYAQRT